WREILLARTGNGAGVCAAVSGMRLVAFRARLANGPGPHRQQHQRQNPPMNPPSPTSRQFHTRLPALASKQNPAKQPARRVSMLRTYNQDVAVESSSPIDTRLPDADC